jgi:hypothetical protein
MDKKRITSPDSVFFAPTVAYRPETWNADTDGPVAVAYVKGVVSLPFVVRAHYLFHYSSPRQYHPKIWGRSGTEVEGVLTCVCAFGLVRPIDDWAAGASFD